ncbi:MAG: LysR family transcriptional regulator [Myxococcota bacterium]
MRNKQLTPPDADERVFLRIVAAGSLKAAAAQIGADPSAVSRRLAALEARLGQQLIRRSTRGSTPTDVGRRYHEGLAPLVAQQDALEAAIRGDVDEPRGLLRVTAAPEFGVRFVVPVLEEMRHRHRDLDVQLALGSAPFDLDAAGLDVAMRIGHLPDSALRSRRLGRVPRTLVASPAYLHDAGCPVAPADLPGHRFLGYRTVDGTQRLTLLSARGGRDEVTVRLGFTVDSIATLVRLAVAGEGIVYGPRWAYAEGLAAGTLTRVLPNHHFDAPPIHALYPARRYLPAKTRVFIEAMARAVKGAAHLEAVPVASAPATGRSEAKRRRGESGRPGRRRRES